MFMWMITSVLTAMRGSEKLMIGMIAYVERHGHVADGSFDSGS